jgi:hypothetical protein
MTVLHDPAIHASIKQRVQSLRPDSHRRWGKMSVDQMLWHVNESMRMALGDAVFEPMRTPPLPKPVLRWLVLNVPWPKGRSPTYKEMVARQSYDFASEQARCLRLIDQLVSVPLDHGIWPVNPTLGPMTGKQWSQLQAKHLEHHLRQFGA